MAYLDDTLIAVSLNVLDKQLVNKDAITQIFFLIIIGLSNHEI